VIAPSAGGTPTDTNAPHRSTGAGQLARLRSRQLYPRRQYLILAVVVVLVVLIAQLSTSRSTINLLDLWLAYGIAALGFYWTFALGGRFAFCQTFMMALGGYTLAWFVGHGFPFLVALLAAVVVTAVAAALVAIVLWRAEHLYFGLGTLAVTEIGLVLFGRSSEFTGTNGNVNNVDYPVIFGITLRTDGQVFWLFTAVLALLLLLAVFLARSPLIRELAGVRETPLVARTTGVRVGRLRLVMFVLGSATGGLSGALITGWQGFIGVDSFGLDLGIGLFLMVILGGVASHWGALAGAAFYVAVPELLSGLAQYMSIIYGALLLIVIMLFPEGLVGVWRQLVGAASRSGAGRGGSR
jgi:branched-chain amino acid transport system permease protein